MACFNIYTVSALSLLQAHRDQDFFKALQQADMLLADGSGAVWGFRVLTGKRPERIPGIDFIDDLCKLCVKKKQSIYCLGGRAEVLAAATEQLRRRYPDIKLAGSHHGYWSKGQDVDIVNQINLSGAAVLLVALGQPRQELFLHCFKDQLQTTVAMGVGGSFDVLAGKVKRAPKWMQQIGLEWLMRLVQEPRRLLRMINLPLFVLMVWWAKLRG